MRRTTWMPALVLASSVLLGGWFLQEGAARDQNVYSQVRLFQEVVDYVSSEYVHALEDDELYDSAIEGLLDQLGDPNTSFITSEEWQNFAIRTTEGQYGGVGLEVLERDGYVTVIAPMPGGPGIRAGIRAGDQFYEIAGESAAGWEVDAAVDILRGPAGSPVAVKMLRAGVEEPIPFTLTREVIQVLSVPYALRLEGEIGLVPLQVFRNTSSQEVRRAIEQLMEDGPLNGLILDLRGNPGGLLDEGIGVSDLFLEPGLPIVETRGRGRGQSETYASTQPNVWPELPVVVLVDEGSASASEIVAGALQDHDRAIVIGAPSFGKGSVQTLFRLTGGNVLRLTTAYWYTPVGRSIQKDREAMGRLPRGVLSLQGALVQAEDVQERPTFQTDAGRTLFGGGGVTPDLWVMTDTLSAIETRALNDLFRQAGTFTSGVFNYAVRFVQEHPDLKPDFAVTDSMVQDLVSFLRDRDFSVDDSTIAQADRFVRVRLEREIALQAFGDAGEAEHMVRYDPQVAEALRVLRGVSASTDVFEAAGVPTGVVTGTTLTPTQRRP